ncbi:hypothetical protein [Streptomyces xanthophaeus]|uniref:hypothetical protein n=1 Tax=Streptomyces xanthophaeus TaxID=67385 RepID=UPI003659D03C
MVVGEAQAAAVLQDEGEAEGFRGVGGEDEEGVAVLAVAVQAGGAEVGLGAQGPGDEVGQAGGGVVEDQAAGGVGAAVAVEDGQGAVAF